jgi:hypothetical protein
MIILMQCLVVLAVWYAVIRAVIMVMKKNPESRSACDEIAGYITFGMLAIEIALLLGAIWL